MAKSRMVFALGVLLGIAALWGVAIGTDEAMRYQLRYPLLGCAGLWLLFSVGLRKQLRVIQVPLFFAGLMGLGGWLGTLAGSRPVAFLLNPTLLLGLPLLGLVVQTWLWKRELKPTRQYLWVGIWIAIACAIAFWFPAGELILAASGTLAIFLVFLMIYASEEALRAFQPREVLSAAADIIPTAFHGVYRAWVGKS